MTFSSTRRIVVHPQVEHDVDARAVRQSADPVGGRALAHVADARRRVVGSVAPRWNARSNVASCAAVTPSAASPAQVNPMLTKHSGLTRPARRRGDPAARRRCRPPAAPMNARARRGVGDAEDEVPRQIDAVAAQDGALDVGVVDRASSASAAHGQERWRGSAAPSACTPGRARRWAAAARRRSVATKAVNAATWSATGVTALPPTTNCSSASKTGPIWRRSPGCRR